MSVGVDGGAAFSAAGKILGVILGTRDCRETGFVRYLKVSVNSLVFKKIKNKK